MPVNHIEGFGFEWEMFPVGKAQIQSHTRVLGVFFGESQRRRGQIDTGRLSTALGKSNQIRPNAAADLEQAFSPVTTEIDDSG